MSESTSSQSTRHTHSHSHRRHSRHSALTASTPANSSIPYVSGTSVDLKVPRSGRNGRADLTSKPRSRSSPGANHSNTPLLRESAPEIGSAAIANYSSTSSVGSGTSPTRSIRPPPLRPGEDLQEVDAVLGRSPPPPLSAPISLDPPPLRTANMIDEQVSPRGTASPGDRDDLAAPLMGAAGRADVLGTDMLPRRATSPATDMEKLTAAVPSSTLEQPHLWLRGSRIGSGGYGDVFMGLHAHTGRLFAVKVVTLDKGTRNPQIAQAVKEIRTMQRLTHENIVRYIGTHRSDDELHIYMEYVAGGSIAQLLVRFGAFNERLARRYVRQVLFGLRYLHGANCVHRDIKCANLLVSSDGVVKLADFGCAKFLAQLAATRTMTGTPAFMAPEVITQSGAAQPADIWSLGCTVVEMCSGRAPHHDVTDFAALMYRIANEGRTPDRPPGASAELNDMLDQCFRRTPGERPTADALLLNAWLRVLDTLDDRREGSDS